MSRKSISINYWAVIAAGLIAFTLSLLWYSPILFGEIWTKYRTAPPSVPGWTMLFAPLRELIASYVLALLITQLTSDLKNAVKLIFLLWLAFHAVGMAGAVIWDNMPWQLGMVHAGDWLMKMLFMAIALSLWHKNKPSLTANIER
ncbi:MAG: DUF1761 domain-containing protein [Bacteroidetes bacterium]|nr:DUF1761 domain-containing protein [Bacteroidota bacterium]MBI3482366.1 DUF1761 domain-containing protein [Bacteroidota bacterium]